MPDSRLAKTLLHGQLAGHSFCFKARTAWINVVQPDVQKNNYISDAHNKPVWRKLTCIAHTWCLLAKAAFGFLPMMS